MKVCPQGMICFESMSMGLIFIIILFSVLIIYQQGQINNMKNSELEIYKSSNNQSNENSNLGVFGYEAPSLSLLGNFNLPSNLSGHCNDTLFNAYAGPFKSDSIQVRPPCDRPSIDIRGRVPINVKNSRRRK